MSRDITLGDTVNFKFPSRQFSTGATFTLGGTPVVSIYEDDNITQITAGITLGVDHDGVTGLNLLTVVATGANGFEAGKDYSAIITTGTVDGVSVTGEKVAEFSIQRSAAAVDLANGTDGLTALAALIATLQGDTDDIQTRLPAALVNSRMDSTIDATGFEQGAIDNVWDEALTGSSHNIATSSGRRLRQLEQAFTLASGTIATVTNSHTFTLDTGAVATAEFYEHARLQITEGTGAGQSRIIVGYTSGRVVTLDSDFITNPDTSSLYEVVAADVHVSIMDADLVEGFVATFTNSTTITLDSRTVATTDFYKDHMIIFTHGTGSGQAREIKAYTSGRVVTMSPALVADLSTDTVYHIVAIISAEEIADEVWDEATSDHTTAGSFGKSDADILADTNELQGDNIPSLLPSALVSGRMDSDIGAKTGNVALSAQEKLDVNTEADTALTDYDAPTKAEMDTAHALLATPAQVNTEVDNAFTTQMADSVPTDGVISTREQGIYAILQMLTEFSASGTTLTVKKVDGTTTLMTFTLDDATNPTSLSRAT